MSVYSILLVDDERTITEGLKLILETENPEWKVIGMAEDGSEGIEIALREHPDIIITDVKMPVMDGLEMVRSLSAHREFHAKYLMLSGYSEFEYARQAMRLGVQHYICKPVDEDELAAAMQEICGAIDEEKQKNQELMQLQDAVNGYENDKKEWERRRLLEGMPTDWEEKKDVVEQVKDYIRAHYNTEISLNEIAQRFYLNPYYLSQLFKKKTGMTYQNYLTLLRMEQAKRLLSETEYRIYEIGEMLGYNDTAYFSKLFERENGCKPSEYRRKKR